MSQDKSREQGAKTQEQDKSREQGAGRSRVQGARCKNVDPSLSFTYVKNGT